MATRCNSTIDSIARAKVATAVGVVRNNTITVAVKNKFSAALGTTANVDEVENCTEWLLMVDVSTEWDY